jgi:hypothetical protein
MKLEISVPFDHSRHSSNYKAAIQLIVTARPISPLIRPPKPMSA